jgi:disulfide oxidoreductase YuzD
MVEYVDMADPENQALFPELLSMVEEQDLPYPLIAVNGVLRGAGSSHYYHVLPLVEKALETVTTAQEM